MATAGTWSSYVIKERGGTHWDPLPCCEHIQFDKSRHSVHFQIYEQRKEETCKKHKILQRFVWILIILCFISSRSTFTSRMWPRCTSSLHQSPCLRNTGEQASQLIMRSSKGRFCSRTRGDYLKPCPILCWTRSHRTGTTCADEKEVGSLFVIKLMDFGIIQRWIAVFFNFWISVLQIAHVRWAKRGECQGNVNKGRESEDKVNLNP